MAESEMSVTEIYAVQSFMVLLERELATFEYMCSLKSTGVNEKRRHKNIITDSFLSMTQAMLQMRAATKDSGKMYHPIYIHSASRVNELLDQIAEISPVAVIARYLEDTST